MRILIPFKANNPKSRLSDILTFEERLKLAELMLLDVIDVVKPFGEIKVITPSEIKIDGVEVAVDSSNLDDAINREMKNVPLAVIMSDLPLLNESTISNFFSTEGDVVIAPGRKGGTNMIAIKKPGFRVSYHYGSFFKHLEYARQRGFSVSIFDSFFSSVDIDDREDILELLLHGKGKRSFEYLKSIGFDVKFEKTPKLERRGRVFMQS